MVDTQESDLLPRLNYFIHQYSMTLVNQVNDVTGRFPSIDVVGDSMDSRFVNESKEDLSWIVTH
jgi:hypothetical protein